jgi:hypothetical protein
MPVRPVPAHPAVDRARSSERRHQQVGRAIVAADDHRIHQRERRGARDRLVESAAPGVDLGEIGGSNGDLHRACHRKSLMAVEADLLAGRKVQRGDAIFAGIFRRHGREPLLERLEPRGHLRQGRLRHECSEAGKQSNEPHRSTSNHKAPDPLSHHQLQDNRSYLNCPIAVPGLSVRLSRFLLHTALDVPT